MKRFLLKLLSSSSLYSKKSFLSSNTQISSISFSAKPPQNSRRLTSKRSAVVPSSGNYASWTTEELCQWLSSDDIAVGNEVINKIKDRKVTGALLAKLSPVDFENIFDMDRLTAHRIDLCMQSLKEKASRLEKKKARQQEIEDAKVLKQLSKKTITIYEINGVSELITVPLYSQESLNLLFTQEKIRSLSKLGDISNMRFYDFEDLVDKGSYIAHAAPDREVDKAMRGITHLENFNKNLSKDFEESVSNIVVVIIIMIVGSLLTC